MCSENERFKKKKNSFITYFLFHDVMKELTLPVPIPDEEKKLS